jgi:DNA helicase HerA-like ATPase
MLLLTTDIKTVLFDTLNVVPDMKGCTRIKVLRKNVEQGKAFAEALQKIKYNKLIISFIDFSQEESSKFLDSLFGNWKPSDMVIMIDEVHEAAPERGMGMEYSSEFERAVRHWRNRNVGFIFSTQRPAFTSKKVLGLLDYVLLYRLTYPNDIKVVKELISGMLSPDETEKVIMSIQSKGFLEGYGIDFIP